MESPRTVIEEVVPESRGTPAGEPRPWTVATVRDAGGLAALEPEWDELARRAGRTPFALPALALAWWRHLGRGRPLVVTVRSARGRLLALAPLHERRLGPFRLVRWMGTGLGSVAEVLVDPEANGALDAVWSAVARRRRILDLVEYRQGGGGLTALAAKRSLRSHVRASDRCPVIGLAGLGSADDLVKGSRYLRKKLARYERRASEAGDFRTETVTGAARLEEVLPAVDEVYRRAEEARPRQNLLAGRYRAFTLDAMRTAAGRGQLALSVAWLDGAAIAFDIGFVTGSTLGLWAGRIHPNHAGLAPGHLLLRHDVDWAIREGLERVDLLVGDSDYKQRWTDAGYSTLHVVAARRATAAVARPLVDGLAVLHGLRERAGRSFTRGARPA